MLKNGPIALAFNFLVVVFVLAPLVIVCLVAFTPETTLSVPTTAKVTRVPTETGEMGSVRIRTVGATVSAVTSIVSAVDPERP